MEEIARWRTRGREDTGRNDGRGRRRRRRKRRRDELGHRKE